MPFLNVDGLSIYHELHGDPDGHPILVISGTGGDLRLSFPDRSPLNKAGRTCHYDQRGLGQTDKPEGPYTMAQYADDAAGLIDALGWSSCHVVGTSFGGMVALNLAVRHPEHIERLVLNCTSPGGEHPSFPLDTLADLPVEERIDRQMRLTDTRYDPTANPPMPDIPPAVFEGMLARSRQERTGESLAGYRNQLGARTGHDVDTVLGSLPHPTLVCAGRYDAIAPPANAERLAEHIPNASLSMFDGGHLFMLQDRTAFATMNAFLVAGANASA